VEIRPAESRSKHLGVYLVALVWRDFEKKYLQIPAFSDLAKTSFTVFLRKTG